MSTPRSWGKIEFPVRLIDDEIRKHLEREYEAKFDEDGTLNDWHGVDIEPGQIDGIFTMEDGEALCGEFEELERLLFEKDIPFDRETGMDWQQPLCCRVYRPAREGQVEVDEHIQLNSDGEVVVSVQAIRELLGRDDPVGAAAIRRYLNDNFPAYPPLTDWVKEG